MYLKLNYKKFLGLQIELTSTIASQFDYVMDLDLTNMMNKNSTRKMQHSITVFSVNPEVKFSKLSQKIY